MSEPLADPAPQEPTPPPRGLPPAEEHDLEIDHLQFMGDELDDPWDDDKQPDWENQPPVELDTEEPV